MGGVAGSWPAHVPPPSELILRTAHLSGGAFVAIPINARLISQGFPDRRGDEPPSRFVWRAEDRGGP
jgi:hypothetical protein